MSNVIEKVPCVALNQKCPYCGAKVEKVMQPYQKSDKKFCFEQAARAVVVWKTPTTDLSQITHDTLPVIWVDYKPGHRRGSPHEIMKGYAGNIGIAIYLKQSFNKIWSEYYYGYSAEESDKLVRNNCKKILAVMLKKYGTSNPDEISGILQKETIRLVRKMWPAVVALANILFKQVNINKKEIDAIIEKAIA